MYLDAGAALVSDAKLAQLLDLAERLAGHGPTLGALRKSRGPAMIASNDRGSQINGGWLLSPAQAR
eukprot:5541131-Lingulodinium_polyedra.AAC.1